MQSLGHYYTEGGVIQFRVASMSNQNYEFLLTLHAIIEKMLGKNEGVTEQQIDAWYLAHEGQPTVASEIEGCPFMEAARTADAITRVVAIKLGVDWEKFKAAGRRVLANEWPEAD